MLDRTDSGFSATAPGAKVATRKQGPERKKSSGEQPVAPKPVPASPATPAICPVAGVGASAGGMEAFTELLHHLPNDTGIAFVLIQHLDPKHSSLLTELLSRATSMPVSEVKDNTRAQPNHVYVIPPNANLSISNGVLRLDPRHAHHMPIDHFFRSLAEDQGNKAIGVILSGTASDGTLGLKAIKAEGGITFAQDEKTAKYDGMPRSAILAGCVDFIMPPEGIARELTRLCKHPYVFPAQPGEVPVDDTEHQFAQIFAMLRNTTGVDFVYYKHATIRRRILRRMALHKLERVEQYIEYLRRNPGELTALFQDILINVTSFFREPSTFETLREKIFPQLLNDRAPEDPVRIWAPGCATGEEAYSVAIALIEYMREHDQDITIQVFGTDLSENSLEKARAGVYPESISADVSVERLRRFFIKVNGSYQISRSIRDMCIFARQNLTKDPPFSKLDLITCRNVLIYLGQVLQAKVLRYFHYGLKPTGFLVLGLSETVGSGTELFTLVGGKDKIYAKKLAPAGTNVDLGPFEDTRMGAEIRRVEDWTSGSELQKRVDQVILAKHSPAGVVVDGDLKVLQFRGHTAPYLEHSAGQPSLSLLKMTRGGVGLELRKMIQKVKKTGSSLMSEPMQFASGESVKPVSISITPIKGPAPSEMAFLILFEDMSPTKPQRRPQSEKDKQQPTASRLEELEQELEATKQYLQTVIEEQEAASEELKSAHEEVQSSNEELQSTNEELLTSKEELQSTNEELNTVNEEMQGRNAELTQINNDLNNLLSSVNIPIVMLGNDLRIRRFTPQAERALNLLPTDVGRKVTDFRIKINIPDLEALFLDVIDNLRTKEREVQDQEGRTYLMSIRPYRTGDNKIDGAVMTLFDVTERKQAAEIRYRRLFEAAKDGIVVLDGASAEILDVNPFVVNFFGFARGDLLGRRFWETPIFQGSGMQSVSHLQDGESIQKSAVLRNKKGEQVETDIIANAYTEVSRLVVQMNIRDASARLRAQHESQRDEMAQRQAEKLDAVGRLAASMANDFSNSITTIVGYSDLLKARLGKDDALLRDLEEIRRAGERGGSLARQLLAFGRKQIAQRRPIELNTVLSEMEQVLRVMLSEEIQLVMNLQATGAILADPNQIEQAITTLVINARDAMPNGGRIVIETSDAPDNCIMLSVSDTGAGMDAETKSHLFEPFFTTKPRGFGAGLGLSTIYTVVKQSGGQVRMNSELGQGTTFQILLPRVEQASAEEPSDSGGSETILLVEDEPSIRRLAATLLRDRGYRVLDAGTGPEALRLARQHRDGIDLLVTDVVLPGMSGRELYDRMSGERDSMKVLFMSGHAEEAIVDHGVLDPAFAFLQKPFTPKTLSQKVREALGQ
jgi:two-component system CheB/CheR fusion protein